MKIIKRYKNRKLYDTENHRYIKIPEVSELVKNGKEFIIYDWNTKINVTHKTLAEIIFFNCRKNNANFIDDKDLDFLKEMIKSSDGSFTGYFRDQQSKMTSIT